MRHGELFAKCKPHVLKITTRAVDQNDGRLRAGSIAGKAELSHMETYALDLDKFSRWRMLGLKPRNTERRRRRKHAKD